MNFDCYKESYRNEINQSIDFIGREVDFFAEMKANLILSFAHRRFGNLSGISILDAGCGIGLTDGYLASNVGRLCGVDVAPETVETAKKNNPSVHYQHFDGQRLPFADEEFHIVFAICVLHHVSPAAWEAFSRELARVTKKNGCVMIFEHNPFNFLTRIAVNRCAFDKDAVLLRRGQTGQLLESAGLTVIEKKFILFFPFQSRVFRRVEEALSWLPLGAQYYVVAQK